MVDSEGKITWSIYLDPWGNALKGMGNADDCPFRLQGQYFDKESGLHYNNYRYFDPECRRFVSQDPIRLLGGLSPYQYVYNPLNWVDPFGLCKEEFATEEKKQDHFDKHGAEFGAKSPEEYLQVGKDIVKYGDKVQYEYKGETRTGYVQFMGSDRKGNAKFGFVGTNSDGHITTIHTKSGKDVWKTLNGDPKNKTISPIQ
jgi:RHS repeat-associated protein